MVLNACCDENINTMATSKDLLNVDPNNGNKENRIKLMIFLFSNRLLMIDRDSHKV